jgi:predicted dehydrogenase
MPSYLAREALLAGRHVLVEKPITLKSCEAEELVDIAKRKERILMVDHLLEYHPAIRKLKDLVNQGNLGRLLHLTSERLNLGVIRSEENALWSLAPHDISVILYLLGEEPVEVAAHGAAYLQPGIEDVCYLTACLARSASRAGRRCFPAGARRCTGDQDRSPRAPAKDGRDFHRERAYRIIADE